MSLKELARSKKTTIKNKGKTRMEKTFSPTRGGEG